MCLYYGSESISQKRFYKSFGYYSHAASNSFTFTISAVVGNIIKYCTERKFHEFIQMDDMKKIAEQTHPRLFNDL